MLLITLKLVAKPNATTRVLSFMVSPLLLIAPEAYLAHELTVC
ncbi:protein of unknown function [Shewanella benthica]|uniref:Uncharacterized protein n=1 Tax=Shewanella benthica TaxID=43661 RepID=A0A330MA71_9GAMM|nr:protein of unknown function [Shewanella benthica]